MNTISAALVGLTLVCLPAFAESPLDDLSAGDIADGERLFRIHCARCHGIDGAGGEGSNLARPKLNYATDDIALMAILNEGIPGTGMPAIWTLDADQVARVAGYVRTLGQIDVEPMPGNPERGREIYNGRGGCPACHIVSGSGKGIGPELTTVGDQRGARYLRDSLTDPAQSQSQTRGYQDYLTVRLETADRGVEGLRINEDAFSVQVRDVSGRVESFRKEDLRSYEKIFAHSLMPAYDSALGERDIDDLVSYLMSLRSE